MISLTLEELDEDEDAAAVCEDTKGVNTETSTEKEKAEAEDLEDRTGTDRVPELIGTDLVLTGGFEEEAAAEDDGELPPAVPEGDRLRAKYP